MRLEALASKAAAENGLIVAAELATIALSSSSPIEAAVHFPTFIINLQGDQVRRKHMEDQLDKVGLKPAEFVPAVDGRTLTATD